MKKFLRTFPGMSTLTTRHVNSHAVFSRFILNLPDEELASLERICFQVEQACVNPTMRLFNSLILLLCQPLVLRRLHSRREPQIPYFATEEVFRHAIPRMSPPSTMERRSRTCIYHLHAIQDTSSGLWCYHAQFYVGEGVFLLVFPMFRINL
jgi:hypothetical protein